MTIERFVARSPLPLPAEEVYTWHTRPGAFERLTPPWEKVQILERHGGVEDGGEVLLALRAAGRRRRWLARHHDCELGREFRDSQVEGPFARWEHRHRFVPDGPSNCHLEDEIEYALPLGRLGNWLGGAHVRRSLYRLFRYRHDVTARDLALHQRYAPDRPLRVLVTGASGLVGSALVPFLTAGGHRVIRLVRARELAGPDAVYWDPTRGVPNLGALEELDAVVHLAGENIAGRRWNAEQKARIRDSRFGPTRLLSETLGRLRHPPGVLVAASAVGYYGSRGDAWVDEGSEPGTGFLADVCRNWEAATDLASYAGIRVVNLRLGVVLSPAGGALARMLTPFRLGLGGRIGGGNQFMSWVALDDVLGAIYHAIATPAVRGEVNAVAPVPVTNREFTKTLGRVLRRPTFLPLPAFAARLAFGELADELLLGGARVRPQALLETDYPFLFRDLEPALRHMLGRQINPLQREAAEREQPEAEVLVGRGN
jgi:uncharacterized protein (TIGR01777 family)